MSKSMKICISLPRKLMYEYEKVLNEIGYRSRSKGIQDALKYFIELYESTHEIEEIGTIIIFYETRSDALEYINSIKRDYNNCINFTIQEKMSNKHSIDLIVVKGAINCINALSNKIRKLEEVEKVELSTTSLK